MRKLLGLVLLLPSIALAQSEVPTQNGCVNGGACLVGSLTSSGAISGTTGTFTATIAATGTGAGFTSAAASGTNGFACTTNGCRFDYGAGASDYASSDGTIVTFAGPLATASNLTGNVVLSAGNDFRGTSAATPTIIYGFISAANATTSIPAVKAVAGNALNANDLIFSVQDASPANVFTVDYEGDATLTGKLSATNGGTITLSGGTGTATVTSGAVCVCTDTTANASVKCAVSTTTLTATGTTTDVIAYWCNK